METVTGEKLALLGKLIDEATKVCIVAHMHPDGDAVGSTLAMCSFLRDVKGKDARVILPDPITEQLAFLAEGQGIADASSELEAAKAEIAGCDLLIALDFNRFNRAGVLEQALSEAKCRKVLIDHHLNPAAEDFDLCFSETETSSASELLYWVLTGLPEIGHDATKLPKLCAKALLTGMTTDSNNFANSVYPTTLQMASELIAAGTDRDAILFELYNRYRENRVRAMAMVLGSMKITPDGVAYMILSEADKTALDIREGDTEGFVNIPLSIDGVNFSIFLKEDNGHFRVSIRSKKGWSANMLARTWFNGGGHEQAAGGRLTWPEDLADSSKAAEYIEEVTARFLHGQDAV